MHHKARERLALDQTKCIKYIIMIYGLLVLVVVHIESPSIHLSIFKPQLFSVLLSVSVPEYDMMTCSLKISAVILIPLLQVVFQFKCPFFIPQQRLAV
jgi:hypothetical protein